MKRFIGFAMLGMLSVSLLGCAFVKQRVTEKFRPPPLESKQFHTDQRTTYNGVRKALDNMDFRFVRGGPAQGLVEAISGVRTGSDLRSSHQISVKVRLHPALDGGTQVDVLFSEIVEVESLGNRAGGESSIMRGTALYEVFFRELAHALKLPAGT